MDATAVGILVGAYLLGAIPFGMLLGRAAGIDVRAEGSGNIGATNVARTAGRSFGALTLLLDALNGAAAPLVARWGFELSIDLQVAAGLAAVVGHIFPIYLGFRGGKGVATGAGVFFAITPVAALIALGAFGVMFAIWRVVSIGSLISSAVLVVATVFIDGRPAVIAATAVLAALIFVRHLGNIRRLWRGSEPGI
ncbi:MAG: glycerol-3-phosphate 1-O-acyltransferase PlsY [Myxococcota bacterium]